MTKKRGKQWVNEEEPRYVKLAFYSVDIDEREYRRRELRHYSRHQCDHCGSSPYDHMDDGRCLFSPLTRYTTPTFEAIFKKDWARLKKYGGIR